MNEKMLMDTGLAGAGSKTRLNELFHPFCRHLCINVHCTFFLNVVIVQCIIKECYLLSLSFDCLYPSLLKSSLVIRFLSCVNDN